MTLCVTDNEQSMNWPEHPKLPVVYLFCNIENNLTVQHLYFLLRLTLKLKHKQHCDGHLYSCHGIIKSLMLFTLYEITLMVGSPDIYCIL